MKKEGEKQKALDLRTQGYSFREIADILCIAKSTAALWTRHTEINKNGIARLASLSEKGREKSFRTRNEKKSLLMCEILKTSESTVTENFDLSSGYQKIFCALLFWCEGEKTDSSVVFMNSDPAMVSTFLSMLRSGFSLDESKFRVCLHLHEYHDDARQITFWSKVSNIPAQQFMKIYKKSHTGKRKKPGYEGCASVRYYDYRIAIELKMLYTHFAKKYGRVG